MVAYFFRVDGLLQTRNLVRRGDPKDKFCFLSDKSYVVADRICIVL